MYIYIRNTPCQEQNAPPAQKSPSWQKDRSFLAPSLPPKVNVGRPIVPARQVLRNCTAPTTVGPASLRANEPSRPSAKKTLRNASGPTTIICSPILNYTATQKKPSPKRPGLN